MESTYRDAAAALRERIQERFLAQDALRARFSPWLVTQLSESDRAHIHALDATLVALRTADVTAATFEALTEWERVFDAADAPLANAFALAAQIDARVRDVPLDAPPFTPRTEEWGETFVEYAVAHLANEVPAGIAQAGIAKTVRVVGEPARRGPRLDTVLQVGNVQMAFEIDVDHTYTTTSLQQVTEWRASLMRMRLRMRAPHGLPQVSLHARSRIVRWFHLFVRHEAQEQPLGAFDVVGDRAYAESLASDDLRPALAVLTRLGASLSTEDGALRAEWTARFAVDYGGIAGVAALLAVLRERLGSVARIRPLDEKALESVGNRG